MELPQTIDVDEQLRNRIAREQRTTNGLAKLFSGPVLLLCGINLLIGTVLLIVALTADRKDFERVTDSHDFTTGVSMISLGVGPAVMLYTVNFVVRKRSPKWAEKRARKLFDEQTWVPVKIIDMPESMMTNIGCIEIFRQAEMKAVRIFSDICKNDRI